MRKTKKSLINMCGSRKPGFIFTWVLCTNSIETLCDSSLGIGAIINIDHSISAWLLGL
jgi:hypothetical protein